MTEPTPEAPAGRGRRGYWIPAFIAMAVLVIIGLAVGAGDLVHQAPSSLPGRDIAGQLSLGLQAEEGASRPPAVECPASEPVLEGRSFQCTVAGPTGTRQVIDVVEIDSRGRLQWHLASPAG